MTLNRKKGWDPAEDAEDAEPTRRRGGHPIRSFLVFLLFLAAVLLVFGVLVARTAGFREIVSVQNGKWTGARVRIADSRLAWPYDLVLEDVTLTNALPSGAPPPLAIPSVRVSWRPGRGLEVAMDRPAVRVVEHPDGGVEPEELALLGRARNEGDVAEWLEPIRGRATLRIAEGTLEVVDPGGKPVRRLESVRLESGPVALRGRAAEHGRLTGVTDGGSRVSREWLAVVDVGLVPLEAGSPAGGRDFWKGKQP